MSAVNGDHAEACLLCAGSALCVLSQHALYLSLVHLNDVAILIFHFNGAVQRETLIVACVCIHTCMGKLGGGNAAVAGYRAGNGGKSGQRVRVLKAEQEAVMLAALLVDYAVAYADGGKAAHCLALIISGSLGIGEAVLAYVIKALRGGENAVAEQSAAQLQGLEKVRIFHRSFSFHFSIYLYNTLPPIL